jgi:hypothetical protein
MTIGPWSGLRGAYDPRVKFSRLDHVDWLRFAGLFTYACVGVPLVGEATFELQLVRPSMYLGWWVSYLVFGVTYWSLTRDSGSRARCACACRC